MYEFLCTCCAIGWFEGDCRIKTITRWEVRQSEIYLINQHETKGGCVRQGVEDGLWEEVYDCRLASRLPPVFGCIMQCGNGEAFLLQSKGTRWVPQYREVPHYIFG